MEIVDNRAVLIRTRNPAKYTVIPKSKIVEQGPNGYTVAVYWGLDEMRVLKNLGVKHAPSPIRKKYDWPGRYTPMAHQIETAAFLTLHRRAFVFNEPGTGKTLSALWAADYLMQSKQVRRVLVLCPLSIMQSAWMNDIHQSILHRSAVIAHHSKALRRV
jgi:superfamily II DNA or RNA helicase